MELIIAQQDVFSQNWENTLKELVMAYQVRVDPSQVEPELREGKNIHKGIAAIDRFLQEQYTFAQDWRACTCDKYFFEEDS